MQDGVGVAHGARSEPIVEHLAVEGGEVLRLEAGEGLVPDPRRDMEAYQSLVAIEAARAHAQPHDVLEPARKEGAHPLALVRRWRLAPVEIDQRRGDFLRDLSFCLTVEGFALPLA